MRLWAGHNEHKALESISGARQWAGVVHTRKSGHFEVLMCCVGGCFGRVIDVFGDGKRKRMSGPWEERSSVVKSTEQQRPMTFRARIAGSSLQ
jgi:hypothetical protein